jgi:hypothetical protein
MPVALPYGGSSSAVMPPILGNTRACCFKFSKALLLCRVLQNYTLMKLKSHMIRWIRVRHELCRLRMLDADLSYNFYAVGNFNVIANSPRIIESKRITNDSSTKKEQGIIMIFSSTDLFFVVQYLTLFSIQRYQQHLVPRISQDSTILYCTHHFFAPRICQKAERVMHN